mmetsp:Transcript_3095/g.5573  ORF Transcript_3095/g.5573 Transcript_3095/m.5573 type:complete len:556 (-) Transcript_3095:101-1768(-)|eukprot:CAMPEP_0197649004 /NCGR_PEP_ID=MMETSP1338-20131121/28089_1 /TAXON_ID=43686 ORGANISM="Pelagodinium beii, Strain RCC1491" /NCGR_SAMPLE_ID=MMETSP1338 /ASSEMBLY_ACC=CAM_ASM_000754 /LENGTH=555 /DNA_ID=CAMNT_0043223099 /DNA_START=45 /DNA_END=1712 /DNA_ORIENTATION=+
MMAMPVGQVPQAGAVGALAPGAVKQGVNETLPMLRPTKLFIGGITRDTTTKQLRDHFSQFGRVLDCVAMRQADGRPRGFGYVTLDSSAAADAAMAVPQMIDGRVVDMKRAVPEGSMSSVPQTRMHTPKESQKGNISKRSHDQRESQLNSFDYVSSPLASMSWPWNNPAVAAASAAAASLSLAEAQARLEVQQMHSYGLGMSRDCLELLSAARPAPPGLHLDSSEPAYWEMATTPTAWGANLSAQAPEFVPGGDRPVLGEITNSSSLKVQKEPSPAEPGLIRRLTKAKSLEINTDNIENVDPVVMEPGAEMSPMYATAPAPVGEDEEDESADEEDSDAESVFDLTVDGPPPSIGSVDHSTGNCKRCNFFPKGRCQNGEQCTFCHYPHEKRKPSRQEKRERKAAWAARSEASETPLSQLTLPSPLTLQCDAFSDLALGSPAFAFRPLTGFSMSWQPDEEVSPMCSQAAPSLLSTGPPLLSTTPLSSSSVQLPSPVSLPAQPVAKMVTMGTQTEDNDDDFSTDPDATYSREELLRLRMATQNEASQSSTRLKTRAMTN